MAWEDTYLLSPILLVLLASGSWTEDAELLPTVEGQTIFVKCQYNSSQHLKEKIWCQKTQTESCKVLVSSLSTDTQWPKFFIQEYPKSHFFTVTMTTLTVRDSGLYFCGIYDNHRAIAVLRRFYLVVSKGCCTEDTELLQAVEGQTFLVNCRYDRSQHANMMKVWCQQTSTESCKVLASGLSTKAQGPKFFIWNHPDSHYFTVIMTASTVRDSGLYYCGIHDNRGTITVIKTIRLVVTR
ncbi:trem-like transcript 4 protein, partial [Alexandromys fortis]|uniref:trem-like transcript 4 protein n=1 Tax=Alexandromys fortis TaxID=100897 RepID=UPI0021531D79